MMPISTAYIRSETSSERFVPDYKIPKLPAKVETRAAWYGPELEKQPELWNFYLSSDDIREIEDAIASFLTLGKDLSEIDESNFPLPTLGPKLGQLRDELLNGRGFILVKGLPVQRFTRVQQAASFLGIGSYVGGDRVSQNILGHVLGHVKDIGADVRNPKTRYYTTNEKQRFHTDGSDIVALLCVQVSEEGGESAISSSTAIFNHIMANRPDIAETLMRPFYWDRKGEIAEGEQGWGTAPILYYHDGKIIIHYNRNFLTSLSRFKEVPLLSPKEIEAMDYLESTAADFSLNMKLSIGDMQFVHNHQVLHTRAGFVDSPEKTRHLLRLWLSTGGLDGWKLPWDPSYSRKRGGIQASGVKNTVPLEAERIGVGRRK